MEFGEGLVEFPFFLSSLVEKSLTVSDNSFILLAYLSVRMLCSDNSLRRCFLVAPSSIIAIRVMIISLITNLRTQYATSAK